MDLLGSDRVRWAAWGGAEDPVQSTAYLADRFGLSGIGQAAASVVISDGRAGQVDGRGREAVGSSLGEVGADRDRVGTPATGNGAVLAERGDAAVCASVAIGAKRRRRRCGWPGRG